MTSVQICMLTNSQKRTQCTVIFKLFRKFSFTSRSTCEASEKFLTQSHLKDIEAQRKESVSNYLSNSQKFNLRENGTQARKKKYILSMFPYPSGNLHMGHVRVYTLSDAIARFNHMKGYQVIHPMGWDAFGLPAENAAIEMGINPASWTNDNINSMKKQLQSLGCCFEWSREFATSDPAYYKWTQYIFLKLYKAGLAYRQEATVNWDPVDKTVLANEQVEENGCSWRSGAKVEKRFLKQWFIKTTRFSKDLYDDLSDTSLENWRDIQTIQKNWIGECNGYTIEMKLKDSNNKVLNNVTHLPVHMSEPELLDRVAFLGLRPGHLLDQNIYVKSCKFNFKILNLNAVHPLSGRQLPIVVSDDLQFMNDSDIYVGIPSVNLKDSVICNNCNFQATQTSNISQLNEKNSTSQLQRDLVIKKLKELECGGYESSSKLKDWLISRQRYWGTPIPVIYCDDCGIVPVPEEELPVKLPVLEGLIQKGGHIGDLKEWMHCICPQCKKNATRETDTMDTFFDSSWYYLRYLDAANHKEIVSKSVADSFMPVDLYIGGKEHAKMHLYYARFIFKFLKEQGLVNHKEPFKKLLIQGVVKNKSFQVKETGRYLRPEEVDFSTPNPVEKSSKASLIIQSEKMSKSKFNGVNPQSILDAYGIDATRLSITSEVGPQSDRMWDQEVLSRSFDIMDKLYRTTMKFVFHRQQKTDFKSISTEEEKLHINFLYESRNLFIRYVTYQLDATMEFHSAIKLLQQLIKALRSVPLPLYLNEEYEKTLRSLILMFSPICPHLASELWENVNSVSTLIGINKDIPIFEQRWPEVDALFEINLDCKVNEKKTCVIKIAPEEFSVLTEDVAINLAKANEKVSKLLNEKILNVSFTHQPNYKAVINFTTLSRKMKKLKKEKFESENK